MKKEVLAGIAAVASFATFAAWEIGEPIVTYWAGPGYPGHPEKLTERAAKQFVEGGFNVVWGSSVEELDVAAKHGLRVIYDLHVREVSPDDAAALAKLAEKVAAIKDHPALYLYHHSDEPPAGKFESLGKMRDWFARQDPKHATWVNLLPTYANNKQLGVDGEIIRAYWEHVRLFGEVYRPELLSYDHYQFNVGGDTSNYLMNLGIVRQSAAAQGVPFMNGVQACTWRPGSLASPAAPRIPGPDELRYLVWTTLAYGAQGIYYYVYSYRGHAGAIAELDGTTGDKFEALKTLNREFVVVAKELRPLRFVGAYVQGLHAPGTTPYGAGAVLKLSPETPAAELEKGKVMTDSTLVSRFAAADGADRFLVANLDYRKDRRLEVSAPGSLERFDPATGLWASLGGDKAWLSLARGGGVLLRVR